jgi:hypothetical protein
MEKRSKGQSYSKIIELTPDKEIPAHAGGRIFDLTKALDTNRPLQPPRPESRDSSNAVAADATAKAKLFKEAEIDDEIDKAFDVVQPVVNWLDPEEEPDRATELPEPPLPAAIVRPSPSDRASEAQPLEYDPELTKVAESRVPDAEEIIELEEIVSPALESAADDEALIDLIDVVEPIDSPPARWISGKLLPGAAADSEIIDLVDIVAPEQPSTPEDDAFIELIDMVSIEALPTDAEEEIIELVDVVSFEAAPTDAEEAIIELVDVVSFEALPDEEAQEQIINLVESVSSAESAPSAFPGEENAPEARIEEVDLIELDRLLQTEEDRPDTGEQVIQLDEHRKVELPEPEITLSLDDAPSENPADPPMLPMELIGIEVSKTLPEAAGLSSQAIEAAIEKILLTKYAGHIEHLIAAAVEKTVTREIEQIKREFMDEIDLRGSDDER